MLYTLTEIGRKQVKLRAGDGDDLRILDHLSQYKTAEDSELLSIGAGRYQLKRLEGNHLIKGI